MNRSRAERVRHHKRIMQVTAERGNRTEADQVAADRAEAEAEERDSMSLGDVMRLSELCREAEQALSEAKRARDEAIRAELARHTIRELAAAADLSDVQVYRIAGRALPR